MLLEVSIIAAILTTISFVPQAIKVIRTKDTSSLSLSMYVMFTIGVSCWLIYGIGKQDVAIAGSNFITLGFAMVILGYKIRNIVSGVDKRVPEQV